VTVFGRDGGAGTSGSFGHYRARDGSAGGPVEVDLERPHAAVVVGKRGTGKSYTLGVLAEELLDARGVTPLVVDPMGSFDGLAAAGARVVEPRVPAADLPPAAWPDLLGLDADAAAGSLVWRAAGRAETLAAMRDWVADAEAAPAARRAAANHLALAAEWGVFAPDGAVLDGPVVVDCSGVERAPLNAVARVVAAAAYRDAADGPMPWVLLDEAHACTGVAWPAIARLLTRGRAPGASVVLATQRPSALPAVALSQADLLVAHRLTSEADLDALAAARPSYLRNPLAEQLPDAPGAAVVVDDATESVHAVRVRERRTPHGGATPRASDRGPPVRPPESR
jgi:hypothetical protein